MMKNKEIIASQQAINRKLWAKENGRMHSVDANRLIAEFMGWKSRTNEETNTQQFFLAQPDHWYLKDESELQYHTSWDWLMPVVQKCFEGAHEDDFFEISGSLPDMESTYKSVVEFIKQYTITQNQDDE